MAHSLPDTNTVVAASQAVARSQYGASPTTPLGTKEVNCETHGPYTSRGDRLNVGKGREIWTQCPGCAKDYQAKREEEDLRVGQRRDDNLRTERIEQTNVPKRFLERTLGNFVAATPAQVNAVTTARDYLEAFSDNLERGRSLVFSGGPGTGKSHLAAGILVPLAQKYEVRYMTCMDMIRIIRDTWRKDSEVSELDVLHRLGEVVDLLVIDEVGVQYGTDAEQTLLFDVLDRRYRNVRPTILLTNQNTVGFKGFVGDRVMDRLTEIASWVPFSWESYRGTARRHEVAS